MVMQVGISLTTFMPFGLRLALLWPSFLFSLFWLWSTLGLFWLKNPTQNGFWEKEFVGSFQLESLRINLASSTCEFMCPVVQKWSSDLFILSMFFLLYWLYSQAVLSDVEASVHTAAVIFYIFLNNSGKSQDWAHMPSVTYHLWATYWPREWNVPVA